MIKILIADDHLIVREGIKRIIDDSADMNVVAEASSGLEALELVWKNKYDLILLDISMPGQNGLQTLKEIKKHDKNVPVLVDGCQSVPHIKVDVTDLNCDFYAFSAHKVYGPTGVGILYAKKKWLERLPPYIGGGAMISEVKKDKIIYAPLPEKYEAGTMPTAEVITFNESLKFIQSIGKDNLMKHENEITNYALEKLRKINSIKIIGNPKNKAGVIAFTIKGIHPHDIATILDEDGVAIRAGHHCCQILHEKLNLTATARVSIGVYNTKDDIDILCKAIENCRKIFDLK